MAEARTNKKFKSVERSELYVSARGGIFLIVDGAEWLLGSKGTGGMASMYRWAGCWLSRSIQCRRRVGAEIHLKLQSTNQVP